MRSELIALAILPAACGESGSHPPDDANGITDSSGTSACPSSCFEQRWWINVGSSNCTVFCMGNPGYPECAASDCMQISVERFDAGSVRSLAPFLFSAQQRGFYLLGALMTDSYVVSTDCKLQVDSRPQQTFSCSGDTLTFTVGQYTAATSDQAIALDAAAAMNTMRDYTY